MRLDRVVGKWGGWGKRRVREKVEAGVVRVNGARERDGARQVGAFDLVEVGDEVVQDRKARYVMLHKPLGVVSATVDEEHETVIDLIEAEWATELHLAGRLDRFTSGLMVLTNDSQYSESLTTPEEKVGKRYLVGTDREIPQEAVNAFEEGVRLEKEQVTSAPALVEMISPTSCRLTIYEGKHHQVKRMFARFEIKVTTLHREAIGDLELPDDLELGEWREFVPEYLVGRSRGGIRWVRGPE